MKLKPDGLNGLTTQEAADLLRKIGSNELKKEGTFHPAKLLLDQFLSPLILILIGAAIVSLVIGFMPGQERQSLDFILIILIAVFSALAGFFQEFKAEKAIEALKKMAQKTSTVLRNGIECEVDTTLLVPGDIVRLRPGDVVPADGKLLTLFNLQVNEAPITGESMPVSKEKGASVYMNTYVDAGEALFEVELTGMRTGIGEIASGLEAMGEGKMAFKKEMNAFTKKIFIVVLIMIVLLFIAGFFKFGLWLALMTAISLAVAALPEGLPAIVTLTLAIGARKLASRNALIRRLSVAETIGAVNVICTDKTGTLTLNEMKVTKISRGERTIAVEDLDPEKDAELIRCGLYCNNAEELRSPDGKLAWVGDQTEVALLKLASALNMRIPPEHDRVDEYSFTSSRKMMSVEYVRDSDHWVYAKGAPEMIIRHCSHIDEGSGVRELKDEDRLKIEKEVEKLASMALRVLAFAFKKSPGDIPHEQIEDDLTWLGMMALMDPPRKEASEAVAACKTAGVRIVVITGDNPITASAIASLIGIESKGTVIGEELDRMNEQELREKLDAGVNIFARTSPFHKEQILSSLQSDSIVAMTGDGVNDALALKKADVGIAMGIKGTEVAREASDIILLDDNFMSIVEAIRFGRGIFNNIRKFINYLFTCNFAEVAVLFVSTLAFGLAEPILIPVQILWINLLTDGLPALALGTDPPPPGIMKEPPRPHKESLLNKKLSLQIIASGSIMTIMLLGVFQFLRMEGFEVARTVLFTGFILFEFVRIIAIRIHDRESLFANKWLLAALIFSLGLQMIILYTPWRQWLSLSPIEIFHWAVLGIAALVGLVLMLIAGRVLSTKP